MWGKNLGWIEERQVEGRRGKEEARRDRGWGEERRGGESKKAENRYNIEENVCIKR